MKLKIIFLVFGVIVITGDVIVTKIQSPSRAPKSLLPENQLPAAMSNYSQTFKLNTSPPIWGQPQKSGATNGNPTR